MTKPGAVFVAAGIMLAATACVGDGGQITDVPVPSSVTTHAGTTRVETTGDQVTTTSGAAPSTTGVDNTSTPDTTTGSSTPSDVGRIVRAADDGATLRLRVGETAVLIQADPLAADPSVRGDAVELVELVSVTGTGDRRWEIRAVQAGAATIEAPDGQAVFEVIVEVVH